MSLLDNDCSSQDFLSLAHYFSRDLGTSLLFSGSEYDSARRSFLCVFPYERVSLCENTITRWLGGEEAECVSFDENPWEALKERILLSGEEGGVPEWVGYFAYEMGTFADDDVQLPYVSAGYPDAFFQRCALVFIHENDTNTLRVRLSEHARKYLSSSQNDVIDDIVKRGEWRPYCLYDFEEVEEHRCRVIEPLNSREVYCDKVLRAKKLIYSGDIYQVNLSQRMVMETAIPPFSAFLRLNELNPAPFSAYMSIDSQMTIVSSSPERFLKCANGSLETRPIKGTIQRGSNEYEDEKNIEALRTSEKEKAELLMITDLMRNDLGKVSLPGSVLTKKVWSVESYSNVHHMLSVIASKAKKDLSPIDIVRKCFPGGSITGCPKLRSMQVIAELEGYPRGIYTGSIGYFAGNGNFDFNIAIRTMFFSGNRVTFQLGGAVVTDSDPISEYEETLHKGKTIFESLYRT